MVGNVVYRKELSSKFLSKSTLYVGSLALLGPGYYSPSLPNHNHLWPFRGFWWFSFLLIPFIFYFWDIFLWHFAIMSRAVWCPFNDSLPQCLLKLCVSNNIELKIFFSWVIMVVFWKWRYLTWMTDRQSVKAKDRQSNVYTWKKAK